MLSQISPTSKRLRVAIEGEPFQTLLMTFEVTAKKALSKGNTPPPMDTHSVKDKPKGGKAKGKGGKKNRKSK